MSLHEPSGLMVLTICVIASVIALVTPYWLESDDIINGRHHMGLFATCNANCCTWIFEDETWHLKYEPDLFISTQGLMLVGVLVGLVALLVAILALCCTCEKCNSNNAVAAFIIVGFLCMGSAVVVFGIKVSSEKEAKLKWDSESFVWFRWSYWIAIVAVGLALVSALMYSCKNRK
ncbi:hypothetical protein ACJMK2_004588 [Sinanodonta woodiana]|uniref:Uncharacterized protein n=1 Tax=Sinanodonta woodiana TaxID=1069815 RepID=A0ABD3Y3J0_SINWO